MIDLHIHTTASDGQYTPAEIVAMAVSAGLSTIAITDHDTVTGLEEGRNAAQKAGLDLKPGISLGSDLSAILLNGLREYPQC